MKLNLQGQKFGRLTVISEHGRTTNKSVLWKCLCDCGKVTVLPGTIIKRGITVSCGCYRKEMVSARRTTHGGSLKPEYSIWQGMRKRCFNKNTKRYLDYGGRGISICERWGKFENFLEDMGPRPSARHSIERMNNNGNYEPGNCKWSLPLEQNRNTRRGEEGKIPIRGISWHKSTQKYISQISIKGKRIYLGVFSLLGDAINARKLAEEKYWEGESHV